MKKLSLFLLCGFIAMQSFASMPTRNSNPIPTVSSTNTDTVLSEKVQAAIVKTKSLRGQSVSAASRRGIVTLQGSVETKQQAQDAINTARSVKGVKQVRSQLTIRRNPTRR